MPGCVVPVRLMTWWVVVPVDCVFAMMYHTGIIVESSPGGFVGRLGSLKIRGVICRFNGLKNALWRIDPNLS